MLTYSMEERGGLPLYEYLYRCIRGDILSGTLAAGERLPSKRRLAEHLQLSVITVEGAYQQLEAEGYVYSVAGRGSFVAEDGDQNARRMAELTASLRETIEELRHLGMTEQQWSTLW